MVDRLRAVSYTHLRVLTEQRKENRVETCRALKDSPEPTQIFFAMVMTLKLNNSQASGKLRCRLAQKSSSSEILSLIHI